MKLTVEKEYDIELRDNKGNNIEILINGETVACLFPGELEVYEDELSNLGFDLTV